MRLLAVAMLCVGCGSNGPDTRYYQLAEPRPVPGQKGAVALVIEPLSTDTAYDDERIVYRVTPYRLDYYNYHHWSSAPGTMISNYLERALEHSGRFSSVTREANPNAAAVLGGRVIAIEEIDQSKTRWVGHITLELTLTDPASGKLMWSEQYDETEPLAAQSPEGLARALSAALDRIATRVVPAISVVAADQAKTREATANRR